MELSDSGRYAYASLIALCFHEFYSEKEEKEFRENFMEQFLQHLKLDTSQPVMNILMENGNHEMEPYVDLLLQEDCLLNHGSPVIHDALCFAIKNGVYDSRIRVIIHHLAVQLRLTPYHLDLLEDSVVPSSNNSAQQLDEEEESRREKREKIQRLKRIALIGAVSVGGGVLLGLTGGIAAPLLGASLGTLFGGGIAAATGSVAGVAVFGSLFGIAGAGISGYKMKRRIGNLEQFLLTPLSSGEGSRLHVTIAISGWLPPPPDKDVEDTPEKEKCRFIEPWETLSHSSEQYGLIYETKYMAQLGNAMDMVYNMAISMVASQALQMTVLQGIMAAIALPRTVINLSAIIDNPWGVCCRRTVQVGQMLAEVLLDRTLGNRPVTLVGFSLGARVIYYCLREMYRRGKYKGIVQDAILIGAPVTGQVKNWNTIVSVVAGRLVNAYSRNDWLLKVLYRTTSASVHIAGLQPIDVQNKRFINIDLSHIIDGHSDYRNKMSDVMKAVLLRTNDMWYEELQNIPDNHRDSSSED